MSPIDTRHSEMKHLYSLKVADYTGDVKSQIFHTEAAMEEADVKAVNAKFDEWVKEIGSKKYSK